MNSQHDFWGQFIHEGDIVFDVGAYCGQFTYEFLLHNPSLVVAVEPQSHAASLLKTSYQNDPRVVVYQCALGDHSGSQILYKANSALSLSSLKQDWLGHGRFSGYKIDDTEKVNVMTLDELIAEVGMPSLIKIDAEGTDNIVIRGLSQPVKTIRWEFVQELLSEAIESINRLSSISDYEFSFLPGESWWGDTDWQERAGFLVTINERAKVSQMWGNIYARLR